MFDELCFANESKLAMTGKIADARIVQNSPWMTNFGRIRRILMAWAEIDWISPV